MKADKYGTHVEQRRYEMGWMSPSVRKATQAKRWQDARCENCQHVRFDSYTNRDGGVGVRVLCAHTSAAGAVKGLGHATHENALCGKWSRKEV